MNTPYEIAQLCREWHTLANEAPHLHAVAEKLPFHDHLQRWMFASMWRSSGMDDRLLQHVSSATVYEKPSWHVQIRLDSKQHSAGMSFNRDQRQLDTMGPYPCQTMPGNACQQALQYLRTGRCNSLLQLNIRRRVDAHLDGLGRVILELDERNHAFYSEENSKEAWKAAAAIQLAKQVGTETHGMASFSAMLKGMLGSAKMPKYCGWVRQAYQRICRTVDHPAVTISRQGRVYMPVQYAHARWRQGSLQLMTGRYRAFNQTLWSDAPNLPGHRYIVQTIRRNSDGDVIAKLNNYGTRVPDWIVEEMQAVKWFPKTLYRNYDASAYGKVTTDPQPAMLHC